MAASGSGSTSLVVKGIETICMLLPLGPLGSQSREMLRPRFLSVIRDDIKERRPTDLAARIRAFHAHWLQSTASLESSVYSLSDVGRLSWPDPPPFRFPPPPPFVPGNPMCLKSTTPDLSELSPMSVSQASKKYFWRAHEFRLANDCGLATRPQSLKHLRLLLIIEAVYCKICGS